MSVFWLFIVNRYYPFCVVVATVIAQLDPSSSYVETCCLMPRRKIHWTSSCKPSATIQIVGKICVTCTAEMILFLRVYALMKCNKVILGVCGLLIAAQGAIVGHTLYEVLAYKGPEAPLVAVSGAVHACVLRFTFFSSTTPALISFLSLGLALDVIAFAVILSASTQAIGGDFYLGKLFKVIKRDGTIYFFVVFSSNFVWLLLIFFTRNRPAIQFTHDYPAMILTAIMVNRITMNLRAADGTHTTWMETLSRLEFAGVSVEQRV
ncbi:hypothetical protein ONZ45_g11101 [Pleurotus djamor]|nr:hypothetical protein ONZ45_g11101 [Pleurotus djamor]